MLRVRRIHPYEQGYRYVLVALAIREAIAEVERKPGAQLPSIVTMKEHFGVANMTIRRAIGILVNEKVVISRPGKGTFIAAKPGTADANNPLAQLNRMRESLIAFERATATALAEMRGEIAMLEEAFAAEAAAP